MEDAGSDVRAFEWRCAHFGGEAVALACHDGFAAWGAAFCPGKAARGGVAKA
jgi:hypothetical protein